MNLIILAAGKGSRLFPLTKTIPKSLIDLGDGTTMLSRQINSAVSSGVIQKIYVVTGYRSEQIENEIKQYSAPIPIEIVYNPFYEVSNNLISVWCAQHVMTQGDFIITNGDNIYRNEIFLKVIDNQEGIFVTLSFKDNYDDDDMKVTLSDNRIRRISKEIPVEETGAESVGLVLVKGAAARDQFRSKIMSIVKDEKAKNQFWLEILNGLAEDGIHLGFCQIPSSDWGEIDFHPDVNTIRSAIFNNMFL